MAPRCQGRTVMRRGLFLCLVVLAVGQPGLRADIFRFAYTRGEKYRIVSQVHESVSVNGRFSHESDILDKIAVTVTDTRADSGNHDVLYQSSERVSGSQDPYDWSEEYPSQFWRDGRGAYAIDPSYFMPMVRNVPLFPEGDVRPGGTWTAKGSKAHDFRENFGIQEPFQFPITASYTYAGRETRDGVDCAVIDIDYEVFHKADAPGGAVRMYPTRVVGESHQKYWWDLAGRKPIF